MGLRETRALSRKDDPEPRYKERNQELEHVPKKLTDFFDLNML